jgi:hypothetical protein
MDKTGKNRVVTDKFYTNDDIAKQCVERFYLKCPNQRNIIEPSAGDGAFVHYLCRSSDKLSLRAFDIEPKNIRKEFIIPIEQQDFLKYDFKDFKCISDTDMVCFIGNPPFGRQSTLAKKFIKHITSWDKAGIIAFILPKSFKKVSMQKSFHIKWHLIDQHNIPDNSFVIDGKVHNVPCVFQIWQKKDTDRLVPAKVYPKKYTFVKKDGDFSLRRVGVYASKIDSNTDKSVQSHYFIKMDDDVNKELFLENYSKVVFDTDNTVGPRSISKQEFITKLNDCCLNS